MHTRHKRIHSGKEVHKRIRSDNDGNLKVTHEEAELESQNVILSGEATFEKDEDYELAEDRGGSHDFIDATDQTQIIHDDSENQIQGLISGNTLSSANNQQ